MPSWTIIVPVKGGALAKSRLGPGARVGADRLRLAQAFAQDALAAVLASPAVAHVWVVTGPSQVAASDARSMHDPLGLHDVRARTVRQRSTGLLGAIADGIERAAATSSGPCAVMLSDLPSLTERAVTTALTRLDALLTPAHGQFFVPDAAGSGTVLLAACHVDHLTPAFGPDSARAHESTATRLDWDLPRLRLDVDTADDLDRALALGVGPHTMRVLAEADHRQ